MILGKSRNPSWFLVICRPWRIMLEPSCIMLCLQFLDMQLLCFLYKPYYAHIMLSYVLWPEAHASCSSEECTSCSDVGDATKTEGTVSSYPYLQRRPGYEELLILNLPLWSFKVYYKCQVSLTLPEKILTTILLTKILYYAGICSCALCTIVCLKLCWHNPPRPTHNVCTSD